MQRAHRVSWRLHYGEIPEGLVVCHKCDNPSCVRPNHLFLGTNKENQVDMVLKGRGRIGVKNGRSKLTEEQVIELKESKLQTKHLMTQYGVNGATVRKIKRGILWSHL
jgi:hypothetical protein